MIENIHLRSAKDTDYQSIYEINDLAFGQNSESNLIALLRQNKEFISELSIVAEMDNELVGHILFSKISIKNEDKQFESLALAPMAVRPSFQNLGVGVKLVLYGITEAKRLGFTSLIVLGHEKYYPKFGFKSASLWKIKAPFDVPDSVFMALELKEGALKDVFGTVCYPKEFNMIEAHSL
ncbi:MAG: GNAT family N-acetyltransferase [Bacteroidetes bacterium]|nr:GNAT family N-acetyltransferase [Bacteroidota bacterium]